MKNHTTENLNLDTNVEFTWSLYTQSEEYQVDKEYILRMIDNNPSYFKTLSDEWRADINIASFAIEKTPSLLSWSSEKIRGNKDIVLKAVQHDGFSLIFATIDLQNDKELLLLLKNRKKDVLKVGFQIYVDWFDERMKVLEIYEDEEWMQNHIPPSPHTSNHIKF